MSKLIKLFTALILIAYPFLVGWSLSHGKLWEMSIALMILGIVRYWTGRNSPMLPLTYLAILAGGLSLVFKDQTWLKFYPVAMSLGSLSIFLLTLWRPPSMIERFARVFEPNLPESGVQWTRKVTMVWCGFFLINALIALYTVFFAPMKIWVLYNGFISYLLMGGLLVGEFILRKYQQRKH
ncbi:septation protein IspZ [Acinetobacter sp. MD2(2019)]|uniref:septation protein IspZ n=1 Tax=Acinetobacter sp. MD2(2019) TaxID=2605273 RepID=UPI002D1F1B23|nr:septation protein IspZ [Acinetobacter sp. MD2(2019)]MEB3753604.1 septation protein IspZ [Acinetobacter sp. MD2(2019)]